MNAGGKKAVLWGTALDNLVSWRMVTPDGRVARGHAHSTTTSARSTTPRRRRSNARGSRRDGKTRARARETLAIPGAAFRKAGPRQGRHRQVPGRAARHPEGRLRRHHHQRALHPAHGCRRRSAPCASSSSAQVRDSTPAIVEIKDYLDALPKAGGARVMLAGLEHLDERYVKAVGYATKAKRHGRPKMVLLGDIVGDDDDAVAKAASEVVRIANARGAEGLRRGVGRGAQEVLARPRAHRGDRPAHQRVQDQRGRGHPAAAPRRLHRRHRAHQHRAVDPQQAARCATSSRRSSRARCSRTRGRPTATRGRRRRSSTPRSTRRAS